MGTTFGIPQVLVTGPVLVRPLQWMWGTSVLAVLKDYTHDMENTESLSAAEAAHTENALCAVCCSPVLGAVPYGLPPLALAGGGSDGGTTWPLGQGRLPAHLPF